MAAWLTGAVLLEGKWLRYDLLTKKRKDKLEYGICVHYGGERVSLPGISLSGREVGELLHTMLRCRVTPVTARDVVEDWLCGQ